MDIYLIPRELSSISWKIYENLPKSLKFSIGDQFLRSIDSIGANVSEGYGRYYYLESVRFYYYARGSLWESKYWLELLYERKLISDQDFTDIINKLDSLGVKLNNTISNAKAQNSKNNNKITINNNK